MQARVIDPEGIARMRPSGEVAADRGTGAVFLIYKHLVALPVARGPSCVLFNCPALFP